MKTGYNRIVFPGMAMIAVTYGLARFSYGLFLPEFSNSLQMNETVSGLVASLSYLAYCLTVALSAFLVSAKGPKPVILIAGASAAIGMTLMGLAVNGLVLALGVFIAGISTGLVSPPYAGAVSRWVETPLQSRAQTWVNSGTSLGIALSGPFALFFSSHWRMTYIGFAVISLAVLIWNAYAIPAGRTNAGQRHGTAKPAFWREVWPRAAMLTAAAFVMGVSCAAYWTFSRGFLVQEGAFSNAVTTSFWVVIGVSGILGGTAGVLIEKTGLSHAYRISAWCLSAAPLLLSAFPSHWPSVYLSAALFGASYISLTGVLLVWGVSLFPDRPAAGLGLPFLVLALGQFAGSFLAGMAADGFGLSSTFVLFALIGFAGMMLGNARESRAAGLSGTEPLRPCPERHG